MQRALIAHLLAFAVLAGNVASVTAVYDCSMSGKRSLKSCCCAAAGECPDAFAPGESGRAARELELRSACCSMSYEKRSPTGPTVRGPGNSVWKQRLEQARTWASLVVAAPFGAPKEIDRCTRTTRYEQPPSRDGGTPLFITHRALLI